MKYTYGLNQNSKLIYDYTAATHTQAVVAWYLDNVEDLNGNFISYTYQQEGLTTYITRITYGNNRNSDTGNENTVEFYYAPRIDPVPVHYGEVSNTADQILYKIITKNNNTVFRSYLFEYTSDVYTRLVKVTESAGDGKKLNPLVMKWGPFNSDPIKPGSITVDPNTSSEFASQHYVSVDMNGDGLTDLIGFYYNGSSKADEYIASYTPGGGVRYALGYHYELPTVVDAEHTKQGMGPNSFGDIDGDGKTDIILPIFSDLFGYNHVIFEAYHNGEKIPLNNIGQAIPLVASAEVPLVAYGDFNNDGKDEILYIEKGTNDNLNYPGKIALFGQNKWIDFVHQSPGDTLHFPHGETAYVNYKPQQVLIADFNGDGMQDILVLDEKGYHIYKNNGGLEETSFSPDNCISGSSFTSNYLLRLGDFNGDGLPDFILNKKNTDPGQWTMALNNGKMGFDLIALPGITARDDRDTGKDDDKDNIIVTDFNNDGKSDVIICDAAYDKWKHSWWTSWKEFTGFTTYWYKSTGDSLKLVTSATSGDEINAYNKFFVTGDFNGDGRIELMNYGYNCYDGSDQSQKWRMYAATDTSNKSGFVTTIANGLNQKVNFSYKPLTDPGVYTRNSSSVYPLSTITMPLYAVKKFTSDNGVSGQTTNTYQFQNAVFHRKGKGFLGFSQFTQTNTNTNASSSLQSEFDTTYYSLAKQTNETYVGTTHLSEAITTYGNLSFGGKRVFPFVDQTKTTDLLKGITAETKSSFDSLGNMNHQNTYHNTDFYKEEKTFSSFDIHGNPALASVTMTRKGEPAFNQSQSFIYNSLGKVSSSYTNGRTTSYTYDTYGNPLTVSVRVANADARADSSTYDPTGRFVTGRYNALKQVSRDSVNNLGYLLGSSNINGLWTTNTYDAWGNLLESISPDQKKTVSKQNWVAPSDPDAPAGALFYSVTHVDDAFVEATYFDKAGHSLRKVTTGFDGVRYYTDTKYNVKGQVEEVSETYQAGETPSKKTLYTYDDLGRVKTETLPTGIIVTTAYPNNTVTTSYSTGEAFGKTYDASGLLSTATDPGGTISYQYTSAGKTRLVQSPGSSVRMFYDSFGRQDTLMDPNAGTISYQYNDFGELISQTDGDGQTATMEYDKLGRIKTRTSGNVSTRYAYDAPGAAGMVDSVSSPGKAGMSYKYDRLGLLTEETCGKGSEKLTYKYAYDIKGRLSKLTYPAGFTLKYKYNDNDDLIEIRDSSKNSLVWKIDDVTPKGQISHATYGNHKQITYGYDENDRMNRLFVPGVIDFNYNFNDKQQLTNRDEKYNINSIWKGLREDFTYDKVNRLETAYPNGHDTLRMKYKKDVNDRIESKSDIGVYTYQSGNHRVDEIAAVSSYLPPKDSITYTPEGKVSSLMEADKLLTFAYGIDDQRFSAEYSKSDTTRYTRYYFNNYEKEVNADGTIRHLNYIYAGGSLIGIYEQKGDTSAMHYIYTDYLGSLRCITDTAGAIEQTLSFDAWGNRRNPFTGAKLSSDSIHLLSARGFTGHEHLDEFGLINMNGRVYDPELGIFLSPDNYVQAPDNTQNFNRYAYCFNNPLMYTDPTGNWAGWDDLIVGGIGFAYGYVSYGLRNGDWGWKAVGAGAIGAGTFLMGYYSGGASSTGSVANVFSSVGLQGTANNLALGSAGGMVASGAISSLMPSMNIPIGDNFSMSVTPGIGFGSDGLVGGVNVSATYHNGNNAYSLGLGGNTNSTSISGGYSDGHFSLSYYRTSYGDAIGPDGNSNSQVVGGISYAVGRFSARIENDFMGDRHDRWRSNAVELGFWGGDFVIGTNLYNNDPAGEKQKPIDGTDRMGNSNKNGLGVWPSGKVYSSPLYVGLRNGGNIVRWGYSHPMVQDRTQNWVHRNGFFYIPFIGHQNFYTDDSQFTYGPYMYSGYYNPYSLWQ
jgi:RHS repeat-associated protein